jgi:hypothetical protein
MTTNKLIEQHAQGPYIHRSSIRVGIVKLAGKTAADLLKKKHKKRKKDAEAKKKKREKINEIQARMTRRVFARNHYKEIPFPVLCTLSTCSRQVYAATHRAIQFQ